MRFTNYRTVGLIIVFVVPFILNVSCSDDEDETSAVQFSSSTSTVNEGDGTIEIQISATSAPDSDVEISFEVSGSAYLSGDYSIETPSPITLEAGTQTATIVLNLIDEHIIESSDDDLIITLTSVGANALLSDSQVEHTVSISDNDEVPTDKLQIDLTWDLGEGEDIDDADFDLYLARNVVIEDNVVTDADFSAASENSLGFETLWLTADDEDNEYYVVVAYSEGNVDAEYTLNLNGGNGYDNDSSTETFSAEEVGSAYFYGPFTKSGTSIGRKSGVVRYPGPSLKHEK